MLHQMWEAQLKSWFPRLVDGEFSVQSVHTAGYNCIAWAIEADNQRWWEPDPLQQYFWPIQKRAYTRDCYVEAIQSRTFVQCSDGSEEQGFVKVALYEKQGLFHMARLVSDSTWTSKCGKGPRHVSPSSRP